MKIASVGVAFPENVYEQQVITNELKDQWRNKLPNPEVLSRLHARCGVDKRHLALPLEAYDGIRSWGHANDLWIDAAQKLGRDAICHALTPQGLMPSDINALIFTTVTGVASPSIDARLVNRMNLSPNIKRMPIFGLGCVAGAAGLARAADYVRAYPDQLAVLLSVEICSLTWQRDDVSMANMISTGLFGDGAAAVLVAGSDAGLDGPEIIDTRSIFYPNTQDVMGWNISQDGFKIILSPDVPEVIKANLGSDVDTFLYDHELTRDDISSWIIHTGGPRVLEAVAESLNLTDKDLELSWNSLAEVGNLSSASVLVVLEKFLAERRGEPGTYSVLAAMGPGFCSELVLIRW
ncbi:MAG TPA: 3-oxoacyl-[acyl-carrier-protein] synthase III C-terminal domain-containing protein [Candidatus Limnocylindrales bacterium]|jgi:alkylresorcinol/alkylpyrone synthase|nr:3-oxoacyl-[acyl-carrier-protein] synthase III C-terminal domain-containing protein [Candidatus Limnocylindrales bacterium]